MLITMLIILLIVGVALWLINTYLPMEARIKNIFNIIAIVAVVIWLLLQLRGII